eukprot:6339-Heterococcus_DN1.PRE.3
MKYSTLVNGYTALNLTKLDVLTGLKYCYELHSAVCKGVSSTYDTLWKAVLTQSASAIGRALRSARAFVAHATRCWHYSVFTEVKLGVGYMSGGKRLAGMPSNLRILSGVEVEYETLPGWEEDLSKCKKFADLPKNAQLYVKRVEDLLGVPISSRTYIAVQS